MKDKDQEIAAFERFLESWGKYTDSHVDRALIILMDHNKNAIAPFFAQRDPHWLHKSFRQVGVCDDSVADALIWNLIHASKDFWDAVNSAFENTPLVRREKQLKRELKLAHAEIEMLKAQQARTQQPKEQIT